MPLEEEVPAGRLMHAGQDLDERRLARAVVAEQAHHLTGVDAHRDVLQGDDVVELFRDVLHLDEWRLAVGLRRHLQALSARSCTKRLISTAMSSIAPSTTWNQSASTRAT